mgnify:CR=1 FL=1
MEVKVELNGPIREQEVIALYRSNRWSSLRGSHTLVTARVGGELVGLGNAISDGSLVVYYPHLLVHPDHQGKGVGRKIVEVMQRVYGGFHQQMLTADGKAIEFYKAVGFERAGKTEPMWVYSAGALRVKCP